MAIAHNISNKQKPAITFKVDEKRTTNQIQSQLNKIAQGLTIKIGGSASQGNQKKVRDLTRQVDNALNKLAGMGNEADSRRYDNIKGLGLTQYTDYTKAVNEAKAARIAFLNDPANHANQQLQQELIEKVRIAINEQKRLSAAFKDTTAFDLQDLSYNKVIARITEYQAKFKETLKNTPELAAKLEELNQQLNSKTFKGTEYDAQNRFVQLTNDIRKAGGEAETLGQTIKRVFGEKFGYGIIGSAALMARNAIKQIYTNVVELDKVVVDLQIATGKNRKETQELVKSYSDLGKELGATTVEIAKSADTWLRQGYNIEDTNELIKQSTMLSKLGQMESAEASTALTSSLKGYQLAASDAASVVDKLTAVDMEAAASAGDIATAMAECANSARIAGVDMNTLIGYLTTVKEVTQDGSESVGTFAKTMFARMGNIKAGNLEDPETGENLSDVESALSSVGIKLRSANNQFRDFDDVLSEVANGWNNYSNVQQHAIAVAFAGTRQQEKFLVLMENFGDAMKYAEVSTKSAGTALDKYSNAYLVGVEAAQNRFAASFKKMSSTVLDGGLVAGFYDIGTALITFFTPILGIVGAFDGLPIKIAAVGVALKLLLPIGAAFSKSLATKGIVGGLISLRDWIIKTAASITGANVATLTWSASLKAIGAALATNPIAWITSVISVMSIITSFTDDWREDIEEINEEIEKSKSNLTNIETEISALEELSDKLAKARGNQKALAQLYPELNKKINLHKGFVEGEADAYNSAAAAIREKIKAQQEEAAEEKNTINQGAIKKARAVKVVDEWYGGDFMATDFDMETLRGYLKTRGNFVKYNTDELSGWLAYLIGDADSADYGGFGESLTGFMGLNNAKDALEEYVDYLYEGFSDYIDNYKGPGSSSFIKQFIESLAYSGYNDTEIKKALDTLLKDDWIGEFYDEYLTLVQTEGYGVANKKWNEEFIPKLREIANAYPTVEKYFDGFQGFTQLNLFEVFDNMLLPAMRSGAEMATEEAEKNKLLAQSFDEIYDAISNDSDLLSDIYSSMKENGQITAKQLSDILKEYPDLIDSVRVENGQYKISIDVLRDKFNTLTEGRKQQLRDTKAAIEAEILERKEILRTMQATTLPTWLGSGSVTAMNQGLIQGISAQIAKLEKDLSQADKTLQLLENLTLENFSNSSSKSQTAGEKALDNWKKQVDQWKYQLEINKITSEQYYKYLAQNYKSYLGSYSETADEILSVQEELYNNLKDLYKDDLNSQKDAWEEKKDAVSEYYDNLRKQIEDSHKEEDYEKEQSEKRKEIFDLDMQIAELMRDGSEKAKARIAELEEERLKAEEELLDFETDKAREDELSRLEKEQEAEEKKIQDQIDTIDEQLKAIDEDMVSSIDKIRRTIIDYAAQKGINLDFAYASGTRSSVGGFGRINEKGVEMISAPDGNGNYIPMLPSSYVFSAKATEFLWKLATEHSLPQAMYNSIAKSIKTQSNTPSVNIAQPITITMGDVIIKGNADKQTVADINKQQENTVRMVLQKIKELQK